ncbi:MAG TPA: hypothetical protein DEB74_16210 [Lachnospiraceae bacterium]|nr:hypothetical protein [Lachnospiraceae bacterium]
MRNRSDILRKCYPLVATGSWDAIAISDIEKVIKQTRGAIAYYFKNKKTLFANILDELFFPVFALSAEEREKLSKATVSDFYNRYKTPFERVRDDLVENYGIDNPSRALFNIYIQGSKHYEGFSTSVNDSMKLEEEYMSKIVEGCVTTLIDINRVYIKNVGNLFIESFDLSLLLQFNNKTSTNLIISRCQYYSIVRKCFFYEFTQNY